MLFVRALLSGAILLCGIVILAKMFAALREGGFAILPGLVLGAAMVALGAYRLSLILRAKGAIR